MNFKLIAVLAAGLLSATPAFSAPVTLDFEGAGGYGDPIANFYSGAGVSFGPDALALANDALGPYYSNAPTPGVVMFAAGTDAALNAASGFSGLASFYYSSTAATTVSIYSGLNGSGSALGTFTLAANAQNGCSDTGLCNWDLASVSFSGVAQSIQFGSSYDAVNGISVAAFDNVTIAPVPLPAAVWLMLSGLGGLGTLVRRKRID